MYAVNSGLNLGYSLFFMVGILIIDISLVFNALKGNNPDHERIIDLNVR